MSLQFHNQKTTFREELNLLDTYRKYAKHEQTLAYLSKERGITIRTLQQQFDSCIVGEKKVVVSMDTTSLGKLGYQSLD